MSEKRLKPYRFFTIAAIFASCSHPIHSSFMAAMLYGAMNLRLIAGLWLLGSGAVLATVAAQAAEVAAPVASASASTPSGEALPANCAAADAELTRRLQPALAGSRDLPSGVSLGDALASLYKARALCREGAAARGMLVYIRLSDALAPPSGIQP